MNCLLDLVADVPRLRVKFRRDDRLAVVRSNQAESDRATGVVMRAGTQ